MRDRMRPGKRPPDGGLDLLAEIVALLHRPVPGHEDVHRDEAPPPRDPREDGVKEDSLGAAGAAALTQASCA